MRPFGLLRAVVVLIDLLAILLGLVAAHALWTWWRPHLEWVLHIRWWELVGHNPFMPSGLVLAIAWLLVLRQMGLYDPGRMTSSARIAAGVSRASAVLLVVAMMLQFLLPDRTYSRFLILAFCGFSGVFILAFRLGFFQLQRLLPHPITQERVAIVGTDVEARDMARRIERFGHHAYDLVGFLRVHDASTDAFAVPPGQVRGEVTRFAELVNTLDIQLVVLATRTISRREALVLATRADQMGVRVLQVPFTWGVASPRVEIASLGDLQLIDLTTLSYPSLAEQVKRAIDLVLVSVGGLALLPLMLVVALAIKLQDGGPVFYVQERAGKGGRKFPFFKFRSMVVDADKMRAALEAHNEADGRLFKMRNDPRVTPIGRFIRKYSIDELPQLLNVLRGDMNLVGPRPLPMSDLQGIEEDPEARYWYELRSKVKPGITGAWQVSGRSDLGFREMIQHDINYIQNWSLWLDLVILVKTVPAVLRGRGAR